MSNEKGDPKTPVEDDHMSASGTNVAGLFAAPADLEHWERPKNDAERELERLRGMKVDEIVLEYLGTRDHLDDERHRFQAVETDLKGRLETMSMVMREKADAIGVDAFPIRGVGTAYRNQKVSYKIRDWEAYIEWVASTRNFQCLEKRAAKLAVKEIEGSLGAVPPGIDKETTVEFLVRRNKA